MLIAALWKKPGATIYGVRIPFLNTARFEYGPISAGETFRPSLESKRLVGPPLAHEQPKRLGAAGMIVAVVAAAASAVGLAAMR